MLNDVMVVLGIGGLILAVAVNETIGSEVFGLDEEGHDVFNHPVQIAMRCAISASTLVLLLLDLVYHWTAIRLQLMHFQEKPASITFSIKRGLLAIGELLICAVHPLPLDFLVKQTVSTPTPPYHSKLPSNFNSS